MSTREERIEIFRDTMGLCKSDGFLVEAIRESKSRQRVIVGIEDIEVPSADRYDKPAVVTVSKKRSLEASMGYPDERVAVLNFASATNAGGGVENGSSAQEEAICRCSTLFPCISDETVTSLFHHRHRQLLKSGDMDALYNDDCIYTPDVVVFKSDTAYPKLMPKDKWYKVDVVSCAAPNLRSKPSNRMNPNSGDKKVSVKQSELLGIHMRRIRRILDIAKANGVSVIVLGAFGCGAFENPPEVVAEAFARVIKDYLYDFKAVEFAVYCPPNDTRNYDVFKRRLGK